MSFIIQKYSTIKCGYQFIWVIVMKEKSYIHDDEYYYSIIRNNIRKFRLKQNLTQQDLADMVELSREYICDIENESRNKHLTIAVLGRIVEALNIQIEDFFKIN